MKTIMWDPLSLKTLLGLKGGPKDAEFRKLGEFMEVFELPVKSIIREAGVVETTSHLLLKGLVGMYFDRKLVRIYFPGDMFLDFESYSQQIPSRYQLKVLVDAQFTSLSFENEIKVLNEISDFKEISDHLKARVRNSNEEWAAFSQLPHLDRLRAFEKKFPSLRLIIPVNDLAGLLGVGRSTIIKLRKEDGYLAGKAKSDAELLKEITYPFNPLKHPQKKKLEALSLDWGYELHSFFVDLKEFSRFKNNQQASLSSFLYPEIDFHKGLWISKLFVWLFYLDDKTDRLSAGSKKAFWVLIEDWIRVYLKESKSNPPFLPSRVAAIVNAFQELWNELIHLDQVSETQIELIRTEILDHIKSSRVEAGFRDNNTLPTIEEYLGFRPHTSGAKLAVSLSCLEFQVDETVNASFWEKTAELRRLSTLLILMDNDLFSFKKEQAAGDHMNYIALLVKNEGISLAEAKEKVLEIRRSYFDAFMEQNRKWMEDFNPENHLILQKLKYIKYKISGTRHWSVEISKRYDK
ncbi:hypothetical protein D0X99_19800 [Algoriphagus lacus]|uniref:Terpene synthase n=1 Tax=Algoriphagus lacus TaxID=2056311 RepID=A0A418PLJ6_9BACT|nr:terpene synthase family protein [Algoriphagus lacus]RIW12100.1 hypothetical protein D0X99_19800 [Algoriphagus lacus]